MLLSLAGGVLVQASIAFAVVAVMLRLRHDRRVRRWDRMVAAWEPAMLEVLSGGSTHVQSLYDRVREDQGPDFLSFLMTYVRRLRGEEQAMVRAMADPYLPALLPLLRKGTAESRGNAVMLLARMGMPKYADHVAEALEDESPVVSMIAARSLFRPEHERHFPRVLAHLPRFGSWSRSFLSGMLAAGGPAAAPGLREFLLDREQKPAVRAASADALRSLNDIESAAIAARLLEDESDLDVVSSCLRILKQLGHAEHVPLVRRMAASLDPVVRGIAVSALGALGGPGEAALLLEKVDDPSFWVSLEAVRGLVSLGDVGTVRRLAAADGPWSTLAQQVLSE